MPRYSQKQFEADLRELKELLENQAGGAEGEGERRFRVLVFQGQEVKPEDATIVEGKSPAQAAKHVFRGKLNRHKKPDGSLARGHIHQKITFEIEEITRGSKHKVYGPYVSERRKYRPGEKTGSYPATNSKTGKRYMKARTHRVDTRLVGHGTGKRAPRVSNKHRVNKAEKHASHNNEKANNNNNKANHNNRKANENNENANRNNNAGRNNNANKNRRSANENRNNARNNRNNANKNRNNAKNTVNRSMNNANNNNNNNSNKVNNNGMNTNNK